MNEAVNIIYLEDLVELLLILSQLVEPAGDNKISSYSESRAAESSKYELKVEN